MVGGVAKCGFAGSFQSRRLESRRRKDAGKKKRKEAAADRKYLTAVSQWVCHSTSQVRANVSNVSGLLQRAKPFTRCLHEMYNFTVANCDRS